VQIILQDKVLVGETARRQAVLNPLNTFSSVKRILGRHFSEVSHELQHAPFKGRSSATGHVELWCPSRCALLRLPCMLHGMQQIATYLIVLMVRQAGGFVSAADLSSHIRTAGKASRGSFGRGCGWSGEAPVPPLSSSMCSMCCTFSLLA